jgi:hypothetical protein
MFFFRLSTFFPLKEPVHVLLKGDEAGIGGEKQHFGKMALYP